MIPGVLPSKKGLVIDLSSVPFPDNMGPAGGSEIIDSVPGIPGSGTVHITVPHTILVDA